MTVVVDVFNWAVQWTPSKEARVLATEIELKNKQNKNTNSSLWSIYDLLWSISRFESREKNSRRCCRYQSVSVPSGILMAFMS